MTSLTEAAAVAYAPQDIRINAIGPSYLMTPLVKNTVSAKTIDALVGMHPIGRLGGSEIIDITGIVTHADKASFVTGT